MTYYRSPRVPWLPDGIEGVLFSKSPGARPIGVSGLLFPNAIPVAQNDPNPKALES